MIIRKTGSVAVGAALLSLSGVAYAQETDPPAPSPPEEAQPPPAQQEQTVEKEITVEKEVRRETAVVPAPPPPPAPPPIAPPPNVEPPPPIREGIVVYDGDDAGRPDLASRFGIGLTVGGGVNDFTNDTIESLTGLGGGWDVRLILGTRSFIAGELAYIGSARDVDAIGLDGSAFLMSHGGETAARFNFLSGIVQPYAFGGVGFTNYRINNADSNTSAVSDSDTLAHFPVGGGLDVRFGGFMVDGRGTFRPVLSDDLFGEDEAMHTWEAKLSAGAEF